MDIPLSTRYATFLQDCEKLENLPVRKDSNEFQNELLKLINDSNQIKQQIQQLGIFSINESIDEVSTKELRYLSIDYKIAKLFENSNKNDKIKSLKMVVNLYLQFLYSLENYEVLNKSQTEKLENFKDSYSPKLDELTIKDPVLRREEKIQLFKFEKQLNEDLKQLNDGVTNLDNLDDEYVRDLYIKQLQLFVIDSFKSLESVLLEIEMLEKMGSSGNYNNNELKFQGLRQIRSSGEDDGVKDDREKIVKKNKEDDYIDRLETLTSPPLLSKEGKILRPFTIVSSSRDKLKQRVQGTGQYLPTMSVDEFLENELHNKNGMVKPLEEQQRDESALEVDEENEESVDRETYRKREWDSYTESHAKGSGNTTNRG